MDDISNLKEEAKNNLGYQGKMIYFVMCAILLIVKELRRIADRFEYVCPDNDGYLYVKVRKE